MRFFHSTIVPPKSTNLMPYINPEVDRLIEAAELEFDLAKQKPSWRRCTKSSSMMPPGSSSCTI